VQKIGSAMAAPKNVKRNAVETVLQDFVKQAETQTSLMLGSDGYIRSVLTKALGEDKAAGIIDRVMQGGETGGMEGLTWMDAAAVARRPH
jgi:flagellar motor switch protein FliG